MLPKDTPYLSNKLNWIAFRSLHLALLPGNHIWSQIIKARRWKSLADSSSSPKLVFGLRIILTQSRIDIFDKLVKYVQPSHTEEQML